MGLRIQVLEKGSQRATLCAIMQMANAMKMADNSIFFIFYVYLFVANLKLET